ncbi:hypothetical protein M407DRAFT_242306 [Tulasnella calospora MUT 4182]|uniref:Uncharacterized protein n=1 Tax=Tulasnella calospora MUT 4182 TaxID=1051891 RepID=A0A0C3M8P9_9AGAM|nr:hypothetical protein M407DRAFT_242306 [Tulasnella calospora MUT 4182]
MTSRQKASQIQWLGFGTVCGALGVEYVQRSWRMSRGIQESATVTESRRSDRALSASPGNVCF